MVPGGGTFGRGTKFLDKELVRRGTLKITSEFTDGKRPVPFVLHPLKQNITIKRIAVKQQEKL